MTWPKVLLVAFALWASAQLVADATAPVVDRLCEANL